MWRTATSSSKNSWISNNASKRYILFTCTLSNYFLFLLSPKSQFHYQTYCIHVSSLSFCPRKLTLPPSPRKNLGELQRVVQLRDPATSRIPLRYGSYNNTALHYCSSRFYTPRLYLGHIWNLGETDTVDL